MGLDTILFNGKIYTQDPAQRHCTALAIASGRIAAAGSDEAIKELADSSTAMIDLDGRCVTPGLVDSHLHFEGYSLGLQRLDLIDIPTLDQTLEAVKEEVDKNADDGWIEGRGWNQALWPGGAFPTAADLDRIEPNRPLLLRHRSGHAAWINSRAIEMSKLREMSQDPDGGEIQRDSSGAPTGILFEEAIKLVSEIVPKPSVAKVSRAMLAAQEKALQAGLTGVHDFDGRRCFQAFQLLHKGGALKMRVVKSMPKKLLEHAIGIGLTSGFGDDWLRIGSLKLFADGALGPRTASMIAPYEGEPNNYGIVVTDKEEMFALVSMALQNGISTAVHAIGDKANHDVLDVFEQAAKLDASSSSAWNAVPTKMRHRIEHAQVLHPSDLSRFQELNVIASMQPIHAVVDREMADRHWGPRCENAYAWRSLIESGAVVAFGSDAPVESIRPLDGIYAAVTRKRAGRGADEESWVPRQRITVPMAVAGYTLGAAIASGREHYMGRIKRGYLADVTILDRDIYTMDPEEIPSTGIGGVVVNGDLVYRNW